MINPVKVIVVLTFLHAVLCLPKKTIINQITFLIISLSLFIEVINSILIFNNQPIKHFLSITIIFYFTLWIYLFKILRNTPIKKYINPIICLYLIYGFSNFLYVQHNGFSYYNFVIGSLLYIILFLIVSFSFLKKEELRFFQSNSFVLLFSPIMLFLGLSFMFSFKSSAIISYKILNDIELYALVNYSVNFIFYAILNYYIYKERKLKNA